MALNEFTKAVVELRAAIGNAAAKGIDLSKPLGESRLFDFSKSKEEYYKNAVRVGIQQVKSKSAMLLNLVCYDPSNASAVEKIRDAVSRLDIEENKDSVLSKVLDMCAMLSEPKSNDLKKPSGIPAEIRLDVYADIDELQKVFNAGGFRSSAILCARLLEVCLHRKYFEITGVDLLEKSPGIGLGKIVAKLSEEKVELDPGLMQQIHLINNVRISSVHFQQQAFMPSREQAQAMILYTLDILEKIFRQEIQK